MNNISDEFLSKLSIDIMLPHTTPKNQNGTASCWAFAMCSFWETELAIAESRESCSMELSPWFLAYHKIIEFSKLKMRGGFCSMFKPVPVGGMPQTAIKLCRDYGVVPLENYSVPFDVTCHYRYLNRCVRILTFWGQAIPLLSRPMLWGVYHALNMSWGEVPDVTPAVRDHVCSFDYQHLTSLGHVPYGNDIILDVPDNVEGWTFRNVTLSDLMATMQDTLSRGHSIVWQGCVRRGFSQKRGVAVLPKSIHVSESVRSANFLNKTLTDDHMMHIVGMAHDAESHVYYIAKNSIGTVGPAHGLVFMHEDFVRMNTTAITLLNDIDENS